MKTRLACRVARLACALRETSTSSHVASCPECQAYLRAAASLDATLRRDAAILRDAAPVDFERDLLRSVHAARAADAAQASAESSSTRAPWRSLMTAGVAAAAIVLGAAAFYRTAGPTTPAPTHDDAAALLASVETVSSQIAEDVIPKAGGLIADNPLQTEMTAVYADARAAVDFLALNFLPRSSLVASATPTP